MSLSKRLITVMVIMLFLALSGIMYFNIVNVQYSMKESMRTHSQETAAYLSLIFSKPIEEKNMPEVNTIINSLFDSGHYSRIKITDTDGKVIAERQINEIKIDTVPAWFVKQINIDSPAGTSKIMKGWNIAATLSVVSSPGYAYELLYRNLFRLASFLIAIFIVLFVIMLIALRAILKPLKRTQHQAEAIGLRELEIQEEIPDAPEVKAVVIAMNNMVKHLKSIFTLQAKCFEKLRKQLYKDDVTGLSNHRYFIMRMDTLCEIKHEFIYGALFSIALNEPQKADDHQVNYNNETKSQAYLIHLKTLLQKYHASFAMQHDDQNVILYIPYINLETAKNIATSMIDDVNKAAGSNGRNIEGIGAIAYAGIWTNETTESLLNELNKNVSKAFLNTSTPVELTLHANHQFTLDINPLLKKALEERSIQFNLQPIVNPSALNGPALHHEAHPLLSTSEGEISSATLLNHIAFQAGLSSMLNRLVIEKVIAAYINSPKEDLSIFIKLSTASISDATFTHWLFGTLASLKTKGPINWLGFEIPELAALQEPAKITTFAKRLASLGCGFGLFHVGREFGDLEHLRNLPLSHLKINATFIKFIEYDDDKQNFVKQISMLAKSKNAMTMAEQVRTENSLQTLILLGIDGICWLP